MEKQGMPATGMSLEGATDRTAAPTQFSLVQHETLLASFANRRKAEQAYHDAIAASGYQPPVVEPPDPEGLSAGERERRARGFLGRQCWGADACGAAAGTYALQLDGSWHAEHGERDC